MKYLKQYTACGKQLQREDFNILTASTIVDVIFTCIEARGFNILVEYNPSILGNLRSRFKLKHTFVVSSLEKCEPTKALDENKLEKNRICHHRFRDLCELSPLN